MSFLEAAFCLIAAGLATRLVLVGQSARRTKWAVLLVALGTLGLSEFAWQQLWLPTRESRAQLGAAIPQRDLQAEFASSESCRACHPQEYESWAASYHHSMTRPATPENVIGDFEDQTLESRGFEYRLSREGDEYWVEGPVPEFDRAVRRQGLLGSQVANPTFGRYRVIMTTGKHHWQTYWVSAYQGQQIVNFPFVFLPEQNRWLPREVMFLKPPGWISEATWNASCLPCHTTGGQPGRKEMTAAYESHVVELGISCESCHGPAAEHVAANQVPSRRYQSHLSGEADPTIVQPERLSQQASAEVCGQCHGVSFPKDMPAWNVRGFQYRAGEDLEDTRLVLIPNQVRDEPWVEAMLEEIPNRLQQQFWPDGMARVTGREYPAMVESPCFQHGDMTCLSCHSMHHSQPEDQLAAGMNGNQACLQCHTSMAESIKQHTHHPESSSGSLCYNCHMPHTSYGLLKGSRSHQVSVPNLANDRAAGRPNGCNLCHLDQTERWTGEYLAQWYDQPEPELSEEEQTIAAGVRWLLSGDAGQRALTAWAMGWEPAREASGENWMAPVLAATLNDPYSAVRYIAGRSLQSLPGFADLVYDFIAPDEDRQTMRETVLQRWEELRPSQLDSPQPRVLLGNDGQLDLDTLNQLHSKRDDRPLDLVE